MSAIWLTYAWDDNEDGDIDFIAQELEGAGLQVKLDRWNLSAGQRLWPQIAEHIQNPKLCSAWAIFATPNSLASEPCREELAYALDRALKSRGGNFPIIAISPQSAVPELLPAVIRTRLYVGTSDPDWIERIVAAVSDRLPSIARPAIEPYQLKTHLWDGPDNKRRYVIEVRPRVGVWSPFVAGISPEEKDEVKMRLLPGPSGRIPSGGMHLDMGENMSSDGKWWFKIDQGPATPIQSMYLFCQTLPTQLVFGKADAEGPFVYLVDQETILAAV